MSYASFVTEVIECDECAAELARVLTREPTKYLQATDLPRSPRPYRNGTEVGQIEGGSLNIMAGRLGELPEMGELLLDHGMRASIEVAICHPVRIVVLTSGVGEVVDLLFNPRQVT